MLSFSCERRAGQRLEALRRLTMIAQAFGDADHHLEPFAACD